MKIAYVKVPKDILKIQDKLFFGLTKRRLISLGIAIFIICRVFISLSEYIGENAFIVGGILAMPILPFGLIEDNGVYFEDMIKNYIYFLKNNKIKVYKCNNFYSKIKTNIMIDKEIKKYLKLNERR